MRSSENFTQLKKIITNKPPFHSTKQEICEQGSGSQWKVWLHCVTGHAMTTVRSRTEACGGTFCSSALYLCHAERYKSLKFFVWEDVVFFWKYAHRKSLRGVFSKYSPWFCIRRQDKQWSCVFSYSAVYILLHPVSLSGESLKAWAVPVM